MREIKFRVWDGGLNAMSEPFNLDNDLDCVVGWLGNCELMQFTGLKDSKGTEIYEGDIIKFKVDFPEQEFDNGIVRWADGGYWTSQTENYLEELLSEELNDLKGSEVIGNIHQNPELLN